MNEFISIVIASYNRIGTLKHVIESLIDQTYPGDCYEILVCDSGSSDGTKEFIEGIKEKNIKYLNPDIPTRAGARNFGIDNAKGNIILFTDADIIADSKLIEEHARMHSLNKNIAVVGCEIQADTLQEMEQVKKNVKLRRTLHKGAKKELNWFYFLTGNASCGKKDLIDAGKFDESFVDYGHEDIELGYRLHKNGIRILYNPGAVNYHLHPVGFEEKLEKMYSAGKATVRMFNKHRDNSIKVYFGMTPFSLFFYSLFDKDGRFLQYCRKNRDKNKVLSEILLQHNYTRGIKDSI